MLLISPILTIIYRKPYTLVITFVLILALLVYLVVLVANANDNRIATDKIYRINQLINVGMDIDEAINKLRDDRFPVSDKCQFIENNDYWTTQVAISEISTWDTIRYVLDIPNSHNSHKVYVNISADRDRKITLID